jgi:hypothetical protein
LCAALLRALRGLVVCAKRFFMRSAINRSSARSRTWAMSPAAAPAAPGRGWAAGPVRLAQRAVALPPSVLHHVHAATNPACSMRSPAPFRPLRPARQSAGFARTLRGVGQRFRQGRLPA